MKEKILKILSETPQIISGEKLSSELCISRVSIWKHIKGLQESGYDIIATPKGYKIDKELLLPWAFPGKESKIHYFPEVTSTMEIARTLARQNCAHCTVVIAERQAKGRGRLKRIWSSSEGGLYFTIIIKPKVSPDVSFLFNFLASLILVKILRNKINIDAQVKWPNDILVQDKKILGMLSEMEADTDIIKYINIGIGLNVNNDPSKEQPAASSLKQITGRTISRKKILSEFLDQFEKSIESFDLEYVISEWKKYTMTLNRNVKIVTHNDSSEGMAIDIDNRGALVLKLKDGSIKKIIYGDCFHQS